jgi:hypothetical protein
MSRTTSPLRDRELVQMLADDPELLAIADALVETQQEEPVSPRVSTRRWKPLLVTAVVTAALAGAGVAIADSLGAFNGISAAQHPQTGADVIDPGTLAYMEGRNCGPNGNVHPVCMPIIRGLLVDTARVVGQIPSGQNIYVISTKSDSLCFVVGPPQPEWNCEDPLSRSHPSAVFPYTQDGAPYTVVGIALDGVTTVSFNESGQEVTVPVKDNVWTWQNSSDAIAAPMLSLTAHFADGTSVVQTQP